MPQQIVDKNQNMTMRFIGKSLPILLAFLMLPTAVLAEQVQTIKAGAAIKQANLYLEVQLVARAGANLTVKQAQLWQVNGLASTASAELIDCKSMDEAVQEFQRSPYGRGSTGYVFALQCGSTFGGIFLVDLSMQKTRPNNQASPKDCGDNKILGTQPVLTTYAGHQSGVCFESWQKVSKPQQLLLQSTIRP